MILTQEQFYRRLEIAIGLTARGLQKGRKYTHNGVNVYSYNAGMGETEYAVQSNFIEKFISPERAARRFAELAKGLDPSTIKFSKETNEPTIRHGDGRSG